MSEAEALTPERVRELAAGAEATVVDVRDEEQRRERGFIAGSIAAPDGEVPDDLDDDRDVVVVCQDGERSAELAASSEHGAAYLEGGMDAWVKKSLHTEPSEAFGQSPPEPPKLPGAGK